MKRKEANYMDRARYERVVLGIDPGTAITGYGVVGSTATDRLELLACGVVRTAAGEPMEQRLLELFTDLRALLVEFKPDEVAVEKLFFGRNITTAIEVGQARGVVLLCAALQNCALFEYTPAEVKRSIAGHGNADKQQVQEMVQRTLDLTSIPRPDDAADGVALALCHLQRAHFLTLIDR